MQILTSLQAQARTRMAKQKGSDKSESYWDNLWGNGKKYESTGKKELIKRCYEIFQYNSVTVVGYMLQQSISLTAPSLNLYMVFAEEEIKERAKRAAAAARRWREYSRRGVDKTSTFKLPEAISNKEK